MNNPDCVILIGMPGAGKSTIGAKLASLTGYAFLDSDYVIESIYGCRLQDISDSLSQSQFLDMEETVITEIAASKCIIATGGSVVYRDKAMSHLASLGKIIHLGLSLDDVKERVARNPQRGICFGPGQTLANLYEERMKLYRKYASYECDSGLLGPDECARWIMRQLNLAYKASKKLDS